MLSLGNLQDLQRHSLFHLDLEEDGTVFLITYTQEGVGFYTDGRR